MKNATKTLWASSLALITAAAIGCSAKPASIEVSPDNVTVNAAEEAPTLTVRVLDKDKKDLKDQKVEWKSADPAIVTVDKAGKLTILGSGETKVTASVGALKKDVAVKAALYKAVKVAEPAVTVKVGESKAAAATIANEKDAVVDGTVSFKSADEAVATVDATGKITGVAPGKTTVTASAKSASATIDVTVEAAGPAELAADKAEVQVKAGATDKVTVTAKDAAGAPIADAAVAWTSSDEAVATVAADGTVTGVKAGTATLTGTAGDKTVTVKVTVKK